MIISIFLQNKEVLSAPIRVLRDGSRYIINREAAAAVLGL